MTTAGGKAKAPHAVPWALTAVWVRARFFVALAVAFVVVGRWDHIRTYWDHWTAPAARDSAMGAISTDTEYFCPMEPGVVSDWPAKCPICHMALVRRKKGDMGPLPNGVVARVQLSPERIMLAGVRAATVQYRPLAREIRLGGSVSVQDGRITLAAETSPEEASWLEPGQAAKVTLDPSDGSDPKSGRVISVDSQTRVTIEISGGVADRGGFAVAVVSVPMAGREPFRSMPRGEPSIRPGDPRSVFVCPDHPGEIHLQAGRCPRDEKPLERTRLAANQVLGWWCPMHPKVTADVAGRECAECGGMKLVARIVSYGPVGQVLAVPESAVIDTGARRLVYVESMPGTFDGVEVRLGPRCGNDYPVVEGLEAGWRVAEAGAFLVDAETRLNPSLAAAYFGAKRGEPAAAAPATANPASRESRAIDGLEPADRALALGQKVCPVTGKPLGSMGTPVRAVVKGRPLLLCCDGCVDALNAQPEKYLAKLKPAPSPAHHP
ncbi:heavy metal-binding domain-containing protein [Paludisphaera mucosa]|uniref:Heavy metal-binding domain-containing protein n=1 Tax=Paludisphaera mucosa TaxID=3030827 RepID=A0ABT6F716_9BACT|nr:heavy metal-binding domain-containing protein [Paludisphaera mucosa]MDG3003190.1 heavy metal-binding domain-containing protein [Paludisphaera mucosa]